MTKSILWRKINAHVSGQDEQALSTTGMGIRISKNRLEGVEMFIATNCEQYSYTKITVPIKLLKSPSDYDDCIYYLDIIGGDFSQ